MTTITKYSLKKQIQNDNVLRYKIVKTSDENEKIPTNIYTHFINSIPNHNNFYNPRFVFPDGGKCPCCGSGLGNIIFQVNSLIQFDTTNWKKNPYMKKMAKFDICKRGSPPRSGASPPKI